MLRAPVAPTESRLPLAAPRRGRRGGRRQRPAEHSVATDLGAADDLGAGRRPRHGGSPGARRLRTSSQASVSPTPSSPPEGRWPMPMPTPSTSPLRLPTVTASLCRPSARRSALAGDVDAGHTTPAAPPDQSPDRRSTSTPPASPSWRRCPGSVRRPPRPSSSTVSNTARMRRSTTSRRCAASVRRRSRRSVTSSRCDAAATAVRGRGSGSTRRGRRGRRSTRRSPASGTPARSR